MKKTLCLDFDGVIHSYTSGWQGADVIPDPPIPGAIEFIKAAMEHFAVVIHTSRMTAITSYDTYNYEAFDSIHEWLVRHGIPAARIKVAYCGRDFTAAADSCLIAISSCKPPAFVTLDDRAITFTGTFPDPASLLDFKPWNHREV